MIRRRRSSCPCPTHRDDSGMSGQATFRLGSELRPGVHPLARSQVQVGRPTWTNGRPQEAESGFLERAVGLAGVAADTGQDAVLPGGAASPRSRQNVVDAEVVRRASSAAVLAGELVPEEQVAPRERCFVARHAVVAHEQDHLGRRETNRRRAQSLILVGYWLLEPLSERERRKGIGRDDPGRIAKHHAEGAAHGGDVDGAPGAVEDQSRPLQQPCSPDIVAWAHACDVRGGVVWVSVSTPVGRCGSVWSAGRGANAPRWRGGPASWPSSVLGPSNSIALRGRRG